MDTQDVDSCLKEWTDLAQDYKELEVCQTKQQQLIN